VIRPACGFGGVTTLGLLLAVAFHAGAADPLPKAAGPLSPTEELATFQIVDGFTVSLVACEPDVVDPVAMCFDERGRLFVCEMRGYPNGGVGTGPETRGRIRLLIDRDGDGRFETSQTFADGLRFPMGITPYKQGVIVAVAPDIVYLEDTTGDGRADRSAVLYTGFNVANIQQMVNSLQWGVDNWVYGVAGSDGGTITCPQKPETPAVVLRNRGIRFMPDRPGSLEPTSGGGQYGLTADDYQRWFTATNSQHLRQIILPDHYLRRNPSLSVSAVTADIAEHGAAARVFRISPFEPWRVERTTRRAGGADAKRFPANELVPGGYMTSACSPLIYTADLFGPEYYGNNFVCDPANNLIHREILREKGAAFTAVRAYADREFLASTDTWFRPVSLTLGPDGAIYVLDFYREVIETPLSLPDDLKRQLNLESRGRGRIWRIAPHNAPVGRLPDFTRLSIPELADELFGSNPWRRMTAQRLLLTRDPGEVTRAVSARLGASPGKPGRVNALWTLHALGKLTPDEVRSATTDPLSGVRENAVRLAESYLKESKPLEAAIAALAADPSPRVRFQVALSAHALTSPTAARVVAEILNRDAHDPWTVTAALLSVTDFPVTVLEHFLRSNSPQPGVVARLAGLIGAHGKAEDVDRLLSLIASEKVPLPLLLAGLEGLGQGMRGGQFARLLGLEAVPTGTVTPAVAAVRRRIQDASNALPEKAADVSAQITATRLLAHLPFEQSHAKLLALLAPSIPGEVQLAAVRTLATFTDPRVTEELLAGLTRFSPSTRAAALDALLVRTDRTLALLTAIEKKRLPAGLLTATQVQQLRTHPDPTVRSRATSVLEQSLDQDRAAVVKRYTAALGLKGDAQTGKTTFARHCSACHRLEGVGHDVGPNLLAVLGGKSGDDLLVAIFDPNREVDPRYHAYQVVTADERVLTGLVVAETSSNVTIRRAEGHEDTVLRTQISSIRGTSLSLMPVGLERELTPQDVADLLAYLRAVSK
jgi:putative membrane-bound dehydrogenase-like protein